MNYALSEGKLHLSPCYADSTHQIEKVISQVQAINRLIEEDVLCENILDRINAPQSALNITGQLVLEGHIRRCVRYGIEYGDGEQPIENFTKAVERFFTVQQKMEEKSGLQSSSS